MSDEPLASRAFQDRIVPVAQPKEADEMKACPFCGAHATLTKAPFGFDYPWFVAVKHKRGCEIALTDHCSRTSHKTRAAAIKRWNTRTPPSASIEPSVDMIEAAYQAHRKWGKYLDDEPLPKRGDLYRTIYLAMERARQKDQR
jgi:hypothetical protein